MRILFTSDRGLPDMRIERAALAAKKRGNEAYFAGLPMRELGLRGLVLDGHYELPFAPKANIGLPFWWRRLRRRYEKALRDCCPDVVHANDVIAARLAASSDIPFVYDDHEFWSLASKIWRKRITSSLRSGVREWLSYWYGSRVWGKWERHVLLKAGAVLTVNNQIAQAHVRHASHVFVVPNVPTMSEVSSLPNSLPRPKVLSSVYVGEVIPPFIPYRDVAGFIELFVGGDLGGLTVMGDHRLPSSEHIRSLGLVNHHEMMMQLLSHHIGIIPWRKHWFHSYCSPNKAYEYAHCGLLTLCISDLQPILQALSPACDTFSDYDELRKILVSYGGRLEELEERREEIRQYANQNLTYEKYEGALEEAYERAIA